MNRLLPAVAGALMLLGWTGSARAELNTVTATADTYVRRDNKGPYGSEQQLVVKNKGDGSKTRKVLVRFNLTPAGVTHDPFEAKLELDVASYPETGTTSFYVFGVRHPALAGRQCQASFSEATLKYKSDGMDWLDDSGDGVNAGSSCIYGNAALGLFTVAAGQRTATFSSPALLRYLRDNSAASGGEMTFLIYRVGQDDEGVGFAAKEHPSLSPPRLSWSNRDSLGFEGSTAPNPSQSGPQQFTGTLRIPLAGGTAITFPNASVTATYEGRRLKTFTGTVGMPQLPSEGILSVLSLSGPQLLIGYDYPAAFDEVGLPLEPDTRYFFVRQDTGVAITVADLIELSPPVGGGSTVIALDPGTATFLSYSSAIPFGPLPIEDLAIGFSAKSGLLFTPYDNAGVENVLSPFGGNLFVGGTVGIDLKKLSTSDRVDLSASLHGEAMVNADVTGFASKQQDWLRRLGMNGSATITASVGDYAGISLELASGSVGYERYGDGSLPRFAFAGGASAPHIPNMPFQLKGNVHAAGVIDANDNGMNSFIELTGAFNPSVPFPLDLEGRMRLGVAKGLIEGKVRFLGKSMSASGEFSPQKLVLSGKIEENWKQDGWGFEGTLWPTLTLTPSSARVEVTSASVKACFNIPLIGKKCEGARINEFGFNVSTGRFKVCFGGNKPFSGAPRIPEVCETI